MKGKSIFKTICSLVCCMLVSLVMTSETQADGTEQLGLPSISIAQGSQLLVSGTGLDAAQPGQIEVVVPADVSIEQVLLYWGGRTTKTGVYPNIYVDPGDTDTIQVNSETVSGIRIGGLTTNPYPCSAYRTDITDQDWIQTGQTNVLVVDGLDFSLHNAGASVVVILDDGSSNEIQILDGCDYAYKYQGYQTEPVDFSFEPSSETRVATLSLIVTDLEVPRPAAVDVTIDGVTTRLDDALLDNEGDFLDVVELEVTVPAEVTNVTVQIWSTYTGLGTTAPELARAASLAWIFAGWELPMPDNPSTGCTYTQGYWKNHPYDWPVDNLSLFTAHEAMINLWTPPKKGNAFLILSHQYIAAELNVENGASIPDEVLHAWGNGKDLLEKYLDSGTIPKKASDRALAIAIANVLDSYNNGLLGPGHCDEVECPKPKKEDCDKPKREEECEKDRPEKQKKVQRYSKRK